MSTYNPFDWRSNDGEPSVFAKDASFNPNRTKISGAPPPLLNGSARNQTASIKTAAFTIPTKTAARSPI